MDKPQELYAKQKDQSQKDIKGMIPFMKHL